MEVLTRPAIATMNLGNRAVGRLGLLTNRMMHPLVARSFGKEIGKLAKTSDVQIVPSQTGVYAKTETKEMLINHATYSKLLGRAGVSEMEIPQGIEAKQIGAIFRALIARSPEISFRTNDHIFRIDFFPKYYREGGLGREADTGKIALDTILAISGMTFGSAFATSTGNLSLILCVCALYPTAKLSVFVAAKMISLLLHGQAYLQDGIKYHIGIGRNMSIASKVDRSAKFAFYIRGHKKNNLIQLTKLSCEELEQIAIHPKTSFAVLEELVNGPYPPSVRSAVADNPTIIAMLEKAISATSTKEIAEFIQLGTLFTDAGLEQIAIHPKTSFAVLAELVNGPYSPSVRSAVADNPKIKAMLKKVQFSIDADEIAGFAKQPFPCVRLQAAENKHCSAGSLDILAHDSHWAVMFAAATNPVATPVAVATVLAQIRKDVIGSKTVTKTESVRDWIVPEAGECPDKTPSWGYREIEVPSAEYTRGYASKSIAIAREILANHISDRREILDLLKAANKELFEALSV